MTSSQPWRPAVPTNPAVDATRTILRGVSARDAERPAREVLAAVPWEGVRRRDTLPAAAFLAAIRG
jgi:hypothetical protein